MTPQWEPDAGHDQDASHSKELNRHDTQQDDAEPEGFTTSQSVQSHVSPPASLLGESFFIFIVCMAQFTTQTGLALSIVPEHIIGKSFHTTDPGQLSWLAAAYSLTVGTFILVAGRLGDLYGHKKMFIIGFSWFGLWSILAGFSVWSNLIFFNFCRAFQGLGPAMSLPNAVAIFGSTYPPGRRKEMAFCLFGAAAPAGFVVGGVFVALLSDLAWWPWSYWVMGIVCFILALLGLVAIPRTPVARHDDTNHLSWFMQIDVLGAVTGISGLVLVNFAWNQAPLVGWNNPYIYVLLIIGFLCLVIFTFIERAAPCPLLPRSIFSGDLAWVLGCIAAGWSSFGIYVYYYFQFMQVIKQDTTLLSVAKWAPAPISGGIAAITTGFLLSRVPASVIMFCAMCCFTIGNALTATIPVHQTYWIQAFLAPIITSWGMCVTYITLSSSPSPTLTLIMTCD
jgi:MFS family permease